MTQSELLSVKVGTKVIAKDGYTDRSGVVYGKAITRFGAYLRIKFDDYTFGTCHDFTTVGIGYYLAPTR